MKNQMSRLIKSSCAVIMAALMIVACGRDNNQDRQNAGIPQPGPQNPALQNTCMINGGVGCSWSQYPGGYSHYNYQNGFYSGYSPYSGYNNFGGCQYGSIPIYDVNWGLACVNVQQPQRFAWNSWNWQQQQHQQWQWQNPGQQGGFGGYLMNCNPSHPGSCQFGTCVPMNQVNRGWSTPEYSNFGVCQ